MSIKNLLQGFLVVTSLLFMGCDDTSVWECGAGQTAKDGVCVPKTCENSGGELCPQCDEYQTLMYNSDGSGYCLQTSCPENEKLEEGVCVSKTCENSGGELCPTCNEYQTLMYNSDGSGYCQQTSCPEGERLENGVCIDGTCEYSISGCIPGCLCMLPLFGTEYLFENVNIPYCGVSFSNGSSMKINLNVGNGASTLKDDYSTVYTISDRGPTIKCNESLQMTGTEICPKGSSDDSLVFLKAEFVPAIYKFNVDSSSSHMTLDSTLLLKDASGNPMTGIPNLTMTNEITHYYTKNSREIEPNADGINPKAIVALSDGTFWIGDDYSASLAHVGVEGQILSRLVPKGWENEFNTTACPVINVLPEILTFRYQNRGIEAIAINSDETFLYFMTESPLANPDMADSENSKNIRLFKIEINDPKNYSEYLYQIDNVKSRVTDMLMIENDTLLVLEELNNQSIVYKINLANATKVDIVYDDITTSPTLENSDLSQIALIKTEVKRLAQSFHGMADMGNGKYFFINENNYGIKNEQTQVDIVTIDMEDTNESH